MKILKNIFGSKPKQNTKYEPNTLAEMNGSPDLRLATAKEKEVDIPLPKNDDVKKIPKESSKSSSAKSKTTAKKSSPKSMTDAEDILVKNNATKTTDKSTSKKSNASNVPQKQESVKKSTSTNNYSAKETTVKKVTKKENENKKVSAVSTKKSEPKAKTETAKTVKKSATKSAQTSAPEVKKEVKATRTSTKKTPTSVEKKTESSTKTKVTTTKKSPQSKVVNQKDSKIAEKTKKAPTKKEVASKDVDLITESKTTRSGKFEIKKAKDGRFVFNLYASNNIIVATSQVYSSSTSAMNGIKSVIANAGSAPIEDQSLKKFTPVPYPKWEIYLDKGEEYRFRLCASNGSCVCHSQGYTSKANCKKGIESIIKFASDAEITKVYLDKKEK